MPVVSPCHIDHTPVLGTQRLLRYKKGALTVFYVKNVQFYQLTDCVILLTYILLLIIPNFAMIYA